MAKDKTIKMTGKLDAVIKEAKKEGVNLKGLRVTADAGANLVITRQYCESRGLKYKETKRADGTIHSYCVLPF